MRPSSSVVSLLILLAIAAPAAAQRFSFERSFDVPSRVTLDVSTLGGKIEVGAGAPGRVVVKGTATVRVAFDVPANAAQLAQRIADSPPIERDGDVIRLHPPTDPAERRAATVAYDVTVPPGTRVSANSISGAITMSGLSSAMSAQTQSGAISITNIDASADVSSGSGAVTVSGVTGRLTVTTSSSAIRIKDAHESVRVRTQSGAVDVDVAPTADVDVDVASSGITVTGLGRSLRAVSTSGKINVAGNPGGSWTLKSSSGRIEMMLVRGAAFDVDVTTRSGAIALPSGVVATTQTKRSVRGRYGRGGALVTVESGSGAVVMRIES